MSSTTSSFECRGNEIEAKLLPQAPPPGFEPSPRVPKTRVLPLHHGGMCADTVDTYALIASRHADPCWLLTGLLAGCVAYHRRIGTPSHVLLRRGYADGMGVEPIIDVSRNLLSREAP